MPHSEPRNKAPEEGRSIGRNGVETVEFIYENLGLIGSLTVEHLSIVGVAVGLAVLTGVPIGIAITQVISAVSSMLGIGMGVALYRLIVADRDAG